MGNLSKEECLKICGMEFTNFHPEISLNVQVGNIIYLIGKKGTGKTTALLNLLYHIRHLFWGAFAFVGSTTTAQQLSAHMPTKLILEGFSKNKMDQIYSKISGLVRKYNQGYDLRKHHFAVILDDVCWDKKIMSLPVMRKFHMNCRHIGVTLFVCAQYMMDLGPSLRTQIDYCIFGKNTVDKEIEKIRENYVPIFDRSRRSEFLKIFKTMNITGRMMVVDTATANKSTEVSDVIKVFKTMKDLPSFTFGSNEFWASSIRIPRSWLEGKRKFEEDDEKPRPEKRHKSYHENEKKPYSNSIVNKRDTRPTVSGISPSHLNFSNFGNLKKTGTQGTQMDNFSLNQFSLAFGSLGLPKL